MPEWLVASAKWIVGFLGLVDAVLLVVLIRTDKPDKYEDRVARRKRLIGSSSALIICVTAFLSLFLIASEDDSGLKELDVKVDGLAANVETIRMEFNNSLQYDVGRSASYQVLLEELREQYSIAVSSLDRGEYAAAEARLRITLKGQLYACDSSRAFVALAATYSLWSDQAEQAGDTSSAESLRTAAYGCADTSVRLCGTAISWMTLGLTKKAASDLEGALACYEAGLHLRPSFYMLWFNKGEALLKSGRQAEADAAFGEAIRSGCDESPCWARKGYTLLMADSVIDALACYDSAVARPGARPSAWLERGGCLMLLSRFEEAIICYEKAVSMDPTYAIAWYNLGNMLIQVDRCSEAVLAYDSAIDLRPSWAEAWGNKAVAQVWLPDIPQAAASLDSALKYNPELQPALDLLKRIPRALWTKRLRETVEGGP